MNCYGLGRKMDIKKIESYLSDSAVESAVVCARRLIQSLPDQNTISNNRVLLAYGGGKDSSYMVAWVRYIQGVILAEKGDTFRLRIITNRHAGMNHMVMKNIDGVYRALGVYGDATVECLICDGLLIRRFERFLEVPEELKLKNRTDVLMSGHLFQADARSTFCNACNLSMMNSFGMGAHLDGGVDVIVTGDSTKEQTAYYAWVRHLSRVFGIQSVEGGRGFSQFLKVLDSVAGAYFGRIYGLDNLAAEHRVFYELIRDPVFFNIYQDTRYDSGDHWRLLTEFLGFDFDELMFSFSESDCGNPTLMAHFRGLRAETLLGRSYVEGVREYVNFAIGLMRQKDFPPSLIAEMEARYRNKSSIDRQRARAATFAKEAFDLSTEQIICMIYSPFTEFGKNLERYLSQQKIALSAAEVHALLGCNDCACPMLKEKLEKLSGLSLEQLRQCYGNCLVVSLLEPKAHDPLSKILQRDPHKAVIEVTNNYSVSGRAIEIISGR